MIVVVAMCLFDTSLDYFVSYSKAALFSSNETASNLTN